MHSFKVKDGMFWLDGKAQFIQAGEFHYYRTPQEHWAHRLGLLKAAGFNAVASYIPWLWHQLEEGVSDFDGHSHPMRDLEGFLDLAANMGLWIIPRPGPYIMAETINEGIPPWVFEKYPQVAFLSQGQKRQNIVSYLHPDFLASVRGWYRAIFSVLAPRQVTRGGRIILVQLDNEMGMMAWVRNIMDTNPDTLARFADYLAQSCGAELARRYPTGSLVELLKAGLQNPQAPDARQIVEDYRRFYREYLRQYAAWLLDEAARCGLEVPPVINIHGFGNGGKTFPIGLSQLVRVMCIQDMVSATDVYPGHIGEDNLHQILLVNEMTKTLQNPHQPLFSIEFQAGGNHDFGPGQSSLYDLHSRVSISAGMRAINHYLFFDGENDPILSPVRRHDWGHPVRKDGSLRKHYARYPRLSNVLHAYGSALVSARPTPVTTIGFLLDYFMTEVNHAASKPAADILTHQRDVILFDLIARGLTLTHRPFDTVDLVNGRLNAQQTPLCWVMIEQACPAETQRKLVDYVHQGGKLVLIGRMCVEDFDHQPCAILREALGIQQIQGGVPFTSHEIQVFTHRHVPVSFLETYTGSFEAVFASDEHGAVSGFVQTIGKGRAMVLGAALAANTLEDLDIVHQMALQMGCLPQFSMGEWADVRLSRGEQGGFLFVNNFQDDPLETRLQGKGEAMFGGNPIHLPARRGLILPLDWQVAEGVLLDYCTAEITQVTAQAGRLVLNTEPAVFDAELTLSGYGCAGGVTLEENRQVRRVRLHGENGEIVVAKEVV
ncbi:MAG: beta-galactosidase [Anaerolineales bacterium]|jgi:beta-galactosidase|nr:beta-galactosidase [Anaerolineales bacterium]